MLRITFLMCATFMAQQVFALDCGLFPQMEAKCKNKKCIPRVIGTSISWSDVSTKSFYVRWKAVRRAKCYFIELLSGYTTNVLKSVSCYPGVLYEFTGLKPHKIYGVRVSAMNVACRRGQPGHPARTRTLWAPTVKPTTTPFIKGTPKPGTCGKRFFTCHSDSSECVRVKKWCDRVLNCADGSDERKCPGGCKELDIDFKNGNYSCTRWGSPYSVCTFDCQGTYVRDGPNYIYCNPKNAKWTTPIPTCKLQKTAKLIVLNDDATENSITVQWEPVEGAVRYTFVAVEETALHSSHLAIMRTMSVDAAECCKTVILELKPETEFKITIRGVDKDDVEGMASMPVFAMTGTNLEPEFPEEPGKLIVIDEESE